MNKFVRFIIKFFISIQAIAAVAGIVLSEVLKAIDLRDELIVSLLALIVIDLFIFVIGYLDKITKNTESIAGELTNYGVDLRFVDRKKFDWVASLKEAKHDVFISGTTLTNYIKEKNVFLETKKQVSFLLLDIRNEAVLNGFRRMRYKDNDVHTNQRYLSQAALFKGFYKTLKNNRNMHFAVSDRIMPISYFAVDIKHISSKSFIRVQHYLHEKEADTSTVTYIVKPGSPLFELYREQIDILWENSIKSGTYLDDE